MKTLPNETLPQQILRKYGQVYPAAFAQAADFRAQRGSNPDLQWADYCYLPVGAAVAIVQAEAQRQNADARQAVGDAGNLAAMLAWRQTQGIYRFDPAIYAAVWETPLEGQIPTEVLYRLPEWCVYVETAPDAATQSPGFFAYLEDDRAAQRSELRLCMALQGQNGPALVQQIIHLTEPTLEACIAASFLEGAKQARKVGALKDVSQVEEASGAVAKALKTILAPRLSLLLYLCTQNSDVRDKKTGLKKPMNPQPIKTRNGAKLFAASTPTRWDVGVRLGAAIKAAQERAKSEPVTTEGTHASPRPHVRRSHWHTFLAGTGRTERRLKWMPPLPVNLKPEDIATLPAVLRDVL